MAGSCRPYFKKGPLSDGDYQLLLDWLRERDANNIGRYKQLKRHQRSKEAAPFAHLTPEQQQDAQARLQRYLATHADKIRTLSGRKLIAYIAGLHGCAAAHAKHKGMVGGHITRDLKMRRAMKARVKTRLGLKERCPQLAKPEYNEQLGRVTWYKPTTSALIEQQVEAVHPGHGQPLQAEQSSTNMDGI